MGRPDHAAVFRRGRLDHEALNAAAAAHSRRVLGDTIELHVHLDQRYGMSWLLQPVVAVLFLMAIGAWCGRCERHPVGRLTEDASELQAPTFHPRGCSPCS